ncbi:MAG TPA: LysR family transcriptional regulator [Aromatoleum sp.]|uniref:LysR family transcriptional regulator n=1 Tax=Aromatoleum sp. TaxID=2307007 RepID=UPI002B4A52B1|nr:LysR family transcriptional regulator [Aromatoleum sp.]HJV25819.1 LysR family transcriptional regulator [Aromatoleum sp.]
MRLVQRLSMRQLRALVAVADSGSFTAAAHLLHVTQPAVSMQMKELEEVVGEVLVDGRRQIHLTSAGEILVRQARVALEAIEMAELQLKAQRDMPAGTIEVAAITTSEYFVPYLLAEFGRRYPDVGFRLTVANREVVHKMLREQRADLAITGEPPSGLPLRRIPFAPHPLSFVAAPDHALAARERIPPSALAGERLLLREQGSGTRAHLERFLRQAGVKAVRADEMGSNETLKQAAMAGMGIAFLSHQCLAMELAAGRLVRLNVLGTPVVREWNVLVPEGRAPTPAMVALLDYFQAEGAEQLRTLAA